MHPELGNRTPLEIQVTATITEATQEIEKLGAVGQEVREALLALYGEKKPPTTKVFYKSKGASVERVEDAFVVKQVPLHSNFVQTVFMTNAGFFTVESSSDDRLVGVKQELDILTCIQLAPEIASRIIEAGIQNQSHISPQA